MSDQRTIKDRSPQWLKDAANGVTRTYAISTSAVRPVPDFLIIGTKRGGTTSLFNYLTQHPGVLGMFPRTRSLKSTDFLFAGQVHDERWYRSHFHSSLYKRLAERRLGYRPLSFEASPFYVWDPRVAAKAHAVSADLKALLLLRDPVKRAWSHYQERVQNGVEPLSFADALDAEDERLEGELERMRDDPEYHSTAWDYYSYRRRGEYLPQIENWLESFPSSQLFVATSEDMYADPQAMTDRVSAFLGIPSAPLKVSTAFNATWRTKDSIPEPQADQLRGHFGPFNVALSNHLGADLPW